MSVALIFLDYDNIGGEYLGGDSFEANATPRLGEEVTLRDSETSDLLAQGVVVKVEYTYWRNGTEIVYVILRLSQISPISSNVSPP